MSLIRVKFKDVAPEHRRKSKRRGRRREILSYIIPDNSREKDVMFEAFERFGLEVHDPQPPKRAASHRKRAVRSSKKRSR